jgi:tetratricopeptide (TPR) repeat protein
MTREQLAEGICTPKYLYLIEKGTRTPSNTIIIRLSEKLNTSLFEYCNYQECENPIAVKNIMADFIESRILFDYNKLKKYKDISDTFGDFKRIPWKFEISFNEAMLKLFVDEKPNEARAIILKAISQMPGEYQYKPCHLRQLILLSLCDIEEGRMKAANFNIEQVQKVIARKSECLEFQQMVIISAYIQVLITLKAEDYTTAIEIVDTLLLKHLGKNSYTLHHFSFLFKGYALFKMGDKEEARQMLGRGLLVFLTFDKFGEFNFLNQLGILSEILTSEMIDSRLLQALKNKYHF